MVFALFILEIGEKADDGGPRPQLSKTGEKDGSVNQHTRQPHLLRVQITGNHEEGGDKADDDSQVVHQRAFDALSDDNSHID